MANRLNSQATRFIGIVTSTLTLILSGCAHQIPLTEWSSPLPAESHLYPPTVTTGDTLEIRYYLDARIEPNAYRLGVGDAVRIDIDGHPDLGRETVSILPDGTISLPLIGSVRIVGSSVTQASAAIAQLFADKQLKDPAVVVSVVQGQQRLKRLLESRRQQSDSDTLVIQVYGGVPIQLPFIEPVAVDRPLSDIRLVISDKYAREFGAQLNVVTNLRQRENPTVAVMGEVKNPGRLPMQRAITTMGAIAAAGGYNNAADPRHVVVVRVATDGSYQRWLFDLTAGLNDEKAPQHAFKLNYDDIVIVLKTGIAEANVWIEQYIRNNIPISIGAGIPLGK